VLRAQGRPDEAIPEYETALGYNRNWVNAYNALGFCKLYTGSIDGVIPLVEQAIRLSPRDPEIGNCYPKSGSWVIATMGRIGAFDGHEHNSFDAFTSPGG
jgi:tetratricopeptide (TPR) repeat protein